MKTSSQQFSRLDYLDAVRAFALILGVIFHASLSFMPVFIGWAVMDISTSDTVSVFALLSHSFRMELFFIIAGYFTHLSLSRNGTGALIGSRLVRIGIPFIIGWFILRPLLISGWIMGSDSMRGEADISAALIQGFSSLGELPQELFVGTHLWFLYYLLLITGAALLLHSVLNRWHHKRLLENRTEHITRWLCHSHWGILTLSIPTAFCLWFMQHWGMDTPDKSLLPHIPVTLVYGGFFMFGWLLQRNAGAIDAFARITWLKSTIAVTAVISSVILSAYQAKAGHPQYTLLRACFVMSYAVMMWYLVSLSIGLCQRLFQRPRQWVRYLADGSYWLYLIHLPIVIWLQVAFAELPFHWSLKLLAICAITIGLSLILYEAFVRSSIIGQVLNGRRKPRLWLAPQTLAREETKPIQD